MSADDVCSPLAPASCRVLAVTSPRGFARVPPRPALPKRLRVRRRPGALRHRVSCCLCPRPRGCFLLPCYLTVGFQVPHVFLKSSVQCVLCKCLLRPQRFSPLRTCEREADEAQVPTSPSTGRALGSSPRPVHAALVLPSCSCGPS